jgi:uncharacterized phage protein (TIGR01671 family)
MENIKLRMYIPNKPNVGIMVYRGIYDKNWYLHQKECQLYREINQRDHVYPLMLFSFLQDKNENDIYEGDILKVYWGGHYLNFQVKWSEYLYGFCIKSKNHLDDFTKRLNEESEIIGNIHQNPELLENV